MPTRLRPELGLPQLMQVQQQLLLALPLLRRHQERSSLRVNVHQMPIAPRRAAGSRVGSALLLSLHRKQMAADLEMLSPTTPQSQVELELELKLQMQMPTRTEAPMRMPMPLPMLKERKPPPPPLQPHLVLNSSPERALQTPTVVLHAADSTLGSVQARLWRKNVMVDAGLEMPSRMTMPPKLSRVAAWDAGVLP